MTTAASARNRPAANGALPVAASQTANGPAKQAAARAPSQRLKVIVRRLAPGLTEAEFTSVLGEEWSLGKGKVDWFLYNPGKDSKDPSKPSRPSRAYLHLTSGDHLLPLSDVVRQSIFEDALNTSNSSCLIGPPSVEFAPYGKAPGGRRRTDARAGTIDQDPEFMAFLEGLANPDAQEKNTDISSKPEKVTMTPLVQFLKDKKATKTKDAAVKAGKKPENPKVKAKDHATSAAEESKKNGKPEKGVEKAAKEAVKILNRQASKTTSSTPSTQGSPAASSPEKAMPKLDVTRVPQNQRGAVIAAHIRMLRRDLGLNPTQARRQVNRDTADSLRAEAVERAATESSTSTSQPSISATPKAAQANGSRRSRKAANEADQGKVAAPSAVATAPVTLLKKPEPTSTTPQVPTSAPIPQAPASRPANASSGIRQAFVKHANPSQGVTEPLLKEALERFGPISMVEIDKKKGFAYVDFADADGLKKAIAANPITVAQGTVHVMQRKAAAATPRSGPAPKASYKGPPPPAQRGNARGGVGRGGARNNGGRTGGNRAPQTQAAASDASKASSTVAAAGK